MRWRWTSPAATPWSPSPSTGTFSAAATGAAHRAVEHLDPRRPARARARRHADRPGHAGRSPRRARRSSRRARRIQPELEALVADVAALHDEVARRVRHRRHRHHRPLARAAAARGDAEQHHPKVQRGRRRRDHHVAAPPAPQRAARPRRASTCPSDDPDVDAEPLFDEDLCSSRPPTTRSPTATGSRSPSWPSTRCCSSRRARRSATSSTLQARAGRACGFTPQAEVDGMRLVASLAFEGFGAAVLPASAAPTAGSNGDWKRRRRRRARQRRSRRASPAAGEGCCRPRPGRCGHRAAAWCAARPTDQPGHPPRPSPHRRKSLPMPRRVRAGIRGRVDRTGRRTSDGATAVVLEMRSDPSRRGALTLRRRRHVADGRAHRARGRTAPRRLDRVERRRRHRGRGRAPRLGRRRPGHRRVLGHRAGASSP